MNKFTIFTVILAVSVITVTADLALRDYFSKNEQVSVLTEDEKIPQEDVDYTYYTEDKKPEPQPELKPQPEPQPISSEIIPQPKSLINENLINSAGFIGQFSEKQFTGKIFQLLDITKNPVDAVYEYQIKENGSPIVVVDEIALRDEIRALQLYYLLQNKTKTYIDLSLNETNSYGDRSFYINHAKKPDEAFLTVKIGSRLYLFAYVKSYHTQIKALIQLLS
ncbi:hypothetical protein HZC21_06345 [Candidatus Peregrinibacteria bacterium]|nr:hypothetical protein [Candidatus Peregrinibacteria bacterium]